MLLVNAVPRPSSIEGLGLFAAEPIPAGTLIGRWDERLAWSCSEAEFPALPAAARAFVERYGWRDVASGRWRASVDNSKFINHSATPNTVVRSDGQYALRDIAIGEEITEDYAEFDPDFAEYAGTLREGDGRRVTGGEL